MIAFNQDNIFIVTGASSGIGKATALLLNQLGACVIACGRNEKNLELVRAESEHKQFFITECYDLSADLDDIAPWIKSLRIKYGLLSGMAFCAGKTWNAPLRMYDAKQAQKAFDLLCHAPLLAAKGLCDKRNNVGAGTSLVFVAAAAAFDPNPGQLMYGAAKAALVNGMHCIAKEVASQGVRVNCVSPGLVETPMMDATVAELGQNFLEREAHLYPLGFGQAQDVASAIVFLLSSASRWTTGQNHILSGGR